MRIQKTIIFGLAVVFGILSCTKEPAPQPTPPPEEEVHYGSGSVVGRVTAGSVPVSGVVVSDGYITDTTSLDGCFSLNSAKAHGYVFITIPDGFNVPSEGVLPRFFSPVGKYSQDTACFSLIPESRSEYTMFVLGDMHLANKRRDLQQFETFVSDIGPQMVDGSFAVTLGDMSWDAYWDGFDLADYLVHVNKSFAPRQFFHTIGNHDHDLSKDGDWETAAAYKRIIGPTYYSFNRGGMHFIVLDDIVCTNTGGKRSSINKISAEQVEWVKKDLQYVSKSTPLAIFLHAPMYGRGGSLSLSSAMDLINALRGFDSITVFSGHTHTVYNVDVTKVAGYVPIYESCCGTVCGDWWYWGYDFPDAGLPVCTDGAPGGYKVVKISGGKMSWQYKGTARSAGVQFRTYDRNMICLDASYVKEASSANKAAFVASAGELAAKNSDNLVYINVWDYDPAWKIEVTENGKNLDVKQVKNFKDPMYLGFMEAYCFNHGYTAEYTPGEITATCTASASDHFFQVKAEKPDSTLEITVTDRFGRKYTESMQRPKALRLE